MEVPWISHSVCQRLVETESTFGPRQACDGCISCCDGQSHKPVIRPKNAHGKKNLVYHITFHCLPSSLRVGENVQCPPLCCPFQSCTALPWGSGLSWQHDVTQRGREVTLPHRRSSLCLLQQCEIWCESTLKTGSSRMCVVVCGGWGIYSTAAPYCWWLEFFHKLTHLTTVGDVLGYKRIRWTHTLHISQLQGNGLICLFSGENREETQRTWS